MKPYQLIIRSMEWIIPFLFGLCSTFLVDRIRFSFKKKKIKKFIQLYFDKELNIVLPKLEEEYKKLKNHINEPYPKRNYMMLAFEGFNENILNGISSVEYYDIFHNRFILLNEIKSMIEFLSENLPDTIMFEYFNCINDHLKEKNIIGDAEHLKNCQICIDKKNDTNNLIDTRIKEINILINKILQFKKNCG